MSNFDYEIPEYKPTVKTKEEYTSDEMRNNFSEFYKLANTYYKSNQKGNNDEELHGKDEMYAIISPNDYNKYNKATIFVCASHLEKIEQISENELLVYSSGYWNCVGS